MRTHRRPLIIGWALGLLFAISAAATRATTLPARLHPAGTIDTNFSDSTQQPGPMITDFPPALPDGRHSDEVINALAIQPDGKIVAAGKTNAPNGDDNFALIRYDSNGLIDTEFGHNTLRPGRVITDFRGFKD